jgi:hypothetical protein
MIWRRRLSTTRCATTGALALVTVLLVVLPASALQTSPSEILANPEKYDGQDVTITGTVTNLRETVSQKGNPYYTFDLRDGTTILRVFSFGKSSCGAGSTATVEGRFEQVKHVGRYTFRNEVDAKRITCR